jgi:hypothetical protein
MSDLSDISPELESIRRIPYGEEQLGAAIVHISDEIVAPQVDSSVSHEPWLDDLMEPLENRTDAFDKLLELAREVTDRVFMGMEDLALLKAEKLGISADRKLKRQLNRRTESALKGYVLAYVNDFRAEAADLPLEGPYVKDAAADKMVNKQLNRHGSFLVENSLDLELKSRKLISPRTEKDIAQEGVAAAHELSAIEERIWGTVEEHVTTLGALKRFIEWVRYASTSRDPAATSLLEMFAVDLNDPLSPRRVKQLVGHCMEASGDALDEEFVTGLFTADSAVSADVRAWAGVFTDSEAEAVQKLLVKKDAWPFMMRGAHGAFKGGIETGLLLSLLGATKPFYYAYQQLPANERGVDSLKVRLISGKGNNSVVSGKKKRSVGRVTQASKVKNTEAVTPSENFALMIDFDAPDSAIWPESMEDEEEARVEEAIDAYIGRFPHTKKLRENITAMIDSICIRPYGKGTTPLRDLYLRDGTRVRRLNPLLQDGLPTSTEVAKDTRILYAVKGRLDGSKMTGIIAILRHDEYLRWIANHS